WQCPPSRRQRADGACNCPRREGFLVSPLPVASSRVARAEASCGHGGDHMTARGRKRPSRTRAEWIEEIRRWRKSRQTAAEYGAEHDVHPGTLVFWGSKLRDVVPIAPRRPQRRP